MLATRLLNSLASRVALAACEEQMAVLRRALEAADEEVEVLRRGSGDKVALPSDNADVEAPAAGGEGTEAAAPEHGAGSWRRVELAKVFRFLDLDKSG